MSCITCREKQLRFMNEVQVEKERVEYIDKIRSLWHYFGTLREPCIMCGTKENISCHRIMQLGNMMYDPANRYVICDKCSEDLDIEAFLIAIEEKLRYIEKYKLGTVDYHDFKTLRDFELAIRRGTTYKEITGETE
jgi:hypothetical protein